MSFPSGGSRTSKKWAPAYYLAKICRKLHENEENWRVQNFTVYRSATVSFNVFIEFAEFSDKIFVITVKGFQPATSCVRDDDVPKTLIRHICERHDI